MFRIVFCIAVILLGINFISCKKEKFITGADAKVHFSQDSVLFDTVFTAIGSSTRNIRVINKNNQKIKISSIELQNGASSQFIINVDGSPGRSFRDLEIAAQDSMYIFIQVNVNPTNSNSPLIISDALNFIVNGNEQKVILEAWGQDAYYHRPTRAIKFKDGSYLPYSLVDTLKDSYDIFGSEFYWKKDKPHVIYGYLVVDSTQKLVIPAGTRVYLNYKAGIWVYRYGQIRVLGEKGNEVIFQGARREKDYADEPGQWDRIWINEGSDFNVINYAIIKNGFIGVQAELFYGSSFFGPGSLRITNTRIQNMSMWGLYGIAFKVTGANNLISNCQEHSVNLMFGGSYKFYHCTFSNFWSKDKAREKTTININNYTSAQVLQDTFYFGNCIIDGKRENEINIDVKSSGTINPVYTFSSCWLKTNLNTSDVTKFINVKAEASSSLEYEKITDYNFEPKSTETRIKNFNHPQADSDAQMFVNDLNGNARKTTFSAGGVTAGAYEFK